MPNRLLKEGITDSDKIDKLSPEAEVCFYRLLVVSDDLGRMDARPAVVRARCFPLKEQSNLSARIEIWLGELAKAGLLVRYVVAGQPFVEIANWDQRVRSSGKYPPPDDGELLTDDGQMTDDGRHDAARTPTRGARGGLGLGKGMGASKPNDVRFEAGAWTVPDLLREKWQEAYPAVLIDKELASAASWLLSNPRNAKSNYARFLTNWLTRAQDRAGRSPKGRGDDETRGPGV